MVLGMSAKRKELDEHLTAWKTVNAPVEHVQFGGLSDKPLSDTVWLKEAMAKIRGAYPNASFSAHAYKVNLAEKTPRVFLEFSSGLGQRRNANQAYCIPGGAVASDKGVGRYRRKTGRGYTC